MRSEMISTKKVINYKVADVFDLYNIDINLSSSDFQMRLEMSNTSSNRFLEADRLWSHIYRQFFMEPSLPKKRDASKNHFWPSVIHAAITIDHSIKERRDLLPSFFTSHSVHMPLLVPYVKWTQGPYSYNLGQCVLDIMNVRSPIPRHIKHGVRFQYVCLSLSHM